MLRRTDTALPPELWAGVECTVNRVGDEFHDQLERSGHASRVGDLDLFAGLGVSTMRYPVLWERTVRSDGTYDWSWADERLGRLRALGVTPVVGLLHHGSGPRRTDLLDPDFPALLADYARAVADRYPWVERFTPVNEPLTTARFSALYGLWYPHLKDDRAFARALVNQVRGVVLSMKAIREITPGALLVQTEDLGKVHSTERLAYQARFENERRWLTFDLLAGRVDRTHSLWRFLTDACGLREQELDWFVENSLPPDIVGINHYLTSERFLDHRLEHYPPALHGSNGRHRYADVEAVRILPDGPAGPERLLEEAWDRYRLPIAVTEVHLGCTREQQMRWFAEVWDAARRLRERGVDIRAVTAWSLLGAFDWNSLLTRNDGHYEPGVFDLRGGSPRPTALATLVRSITSGAPRPAAADGPVWWRQPERLIYPAPQRNDLAMAPTRAVHPRTLPSDRKPLLIAGARGRVGRAFLRLCRERGLDAIGIDRERMDIADRSAVESALEYYKPWAVVNAAGYTRVDDAEYEAELCHRENTWGAAILAGSCARSGVRLLSFSTDMVFDGERDAPYTESAPVNPVNVYGRSKAEAEHAVLRENPDALVARTGAFIDPWDRGSFITDLLHQLEAGGTVAAASDLTVSPTYLPDLVNSGLDLLIDGERGIWHLANGGMATWEELGRMAAEMSGLDPNGVVGVPARELGLRAPRPPFSALASERGAILPTLEDALRVFVESRESRVGSHESRVESPVQTV
jgi:dTDP-4-dehydrorhamnose reductase